MRKARNFYDEKPIATISLTQLVVIAIVFSGTFFIPAYLLTTQGSSTPYTQNTQTASDVNISNTTRTGNVAGTQTTSSNGNLLDSENLIYIGIALITLSMVFLLVTIYYKPKYE